jgi:hypothetical protein
VNRPLATPPQSSKGSARGSLRYRKQDPFTSRPHHLMLDTGLRDGEALTFEVVRHPHEGSSDRKIWVSARFKGKVSESAAHRQSDRAGPRQAGARSNRILVTSRDHQHAKVRELLKMPEDFVVDSLRHAMLRRPVLLGGDALRSLRLLATAASRSWSVTCHHRPSRSRAPSRNWSAKVENGIAVI